jgi:hypothetical protein
MLVGTGMLILWDSCEIKVWFLAREILGLISSPYLTYILLQVQ